jgi:hypothetical protein
MERVATRFQEFDVVFGAVGENETHVVTLRSREFDDVSPSDAARGLVHWSAGRALAQFVASQLEPRSKRIIELGAGCAGFPGIVCMMRGASFVRFVDKEERALDVLTQNLVDVETEFFRARPRFEVDRIDFADPLEAQNVLERRDAGDESYDFDYVLAADVLYDEDVSTAAGLFRYAFALLSKDDDDHDEKRFFLSYCHRADSHFLAPLAAEYGFRCVSASAVTFPASAVAAREDDRAEMEIVEFALI